MKYKKYLKRAFIIIIGGVVLYFAVLLVFTGPLTRYEIIKADRKETIRIQKILDENPDVAEKLRAWNNGEIELSDDEIAEIHAILHYRYIPKRKDETETQDMEE